MRNKLEGEIRRMHDFNRDLRGEGLTSEALAKMAKGRAEEYTLRLSRLVQPTSMTNKLQDVDQAKFWGLQQNLVPSLLHQSGMS